MSKFITLEGGDGAGKSTHARRLGERLRSAGLDVELVREPGGTPVGERVRQLVKGHLQASHLAELWLFETARAELVQTVILPALARGTVVVADRFADSTAAYQGHGRGLDLKTIERLNALSTGDLTPDLTLLLDVDPEVALARIGASGPPAPNETKSHRSADDRRFEEEPLEFHRRVVEGFRSLALRDPGRWVVIDADQPVGRVEREIWRPVTRLLGIPSAD